MADDGRRRRRFDRRVFDDDARHVDRFGLLLLTTIAAIVVLSLVDLAPASSPDKTNFGNAVVTFFVGAMVLLAMRASGVASRWRRIADVIVGFGLLLTVGVLIVGLLSNVESSGGGRARPSLLWIIMIVLLPVGVVRRILRHDRVTLRTLLGAISAYLLIAVTFDFVFLTVESFESTPFFGSEQSTTSFMYFSLTTVTTLGYGDLTAKTDLGRLLATTEALIGQIFLVTLVAALVGLYAQGGEARRRVAARRRETTSAEEAPPSAE
jgi:hypothetical protein